MATVTTRYRCPVTPDDCPTSPRRGYCRIHEWEQLVPERQYLTVDEEGDRQGAATSGPGSERDAPSRGADAPGRESRPAGPGSVPPQPDSRPGAPAPATRLQSATGRATGSVPAAPSLALLVAEVLVPVRAAERGPTPLGRDSPDCAHVPGLAALDQVSRVHAEVYWDAGRLYLADRGSSNGTFVDGERLTRPVQLWPGTHRVQLAQPPEAVDISLVELDEFGLPR
ncbi:FHA domain-containing protein [Streptomyces sp. cg35]|uniref:FHA domain-containing protein n=1 Tax=Streptomyces sp. cg35 TaxID=3421650 RepID=UPI003D17E281